MAPQKILAMQDWKTPQKDWLNAIAKQMKANIVVDAPALNQEPSTSRFGGLRRANKLFDGDAEAVLDRFKHGLWASSPDKAS
jgi:type I restriction enzyme R subunit